MKLMAILMGLLLAGAGQEAFARDDGKANRFQSFVSVLGPVSVSPDQTLKVCSTDISVVTNLGDDRRRSKRRHDHRIKKARTVWSSSRLEVFDSLDTHRPLPLRFDDIVFSSGKGSCTEIPGYEIASDGLQRSVVIVLTTLTGARAVFDPLVTGQLTAPGTTSAIGLLLPAVQKVRESAPSNNCCTCVPVCACGVCD